MQRGIKKPDRGRQSLQLAEDSSEVLALVGKQLGKCPATILLVVCKDHLTHGIDAITLKKHMLRPAEAHSLCAESKSAPCLLRGIRICPDLELGKFRAPVHQALEVTKLPGLPSIGIAMNQSCNDLRRHG